MYTFPIFFFWTEPNESFDSIPFTGTHLNVGIVPVVDNILVMDDTLHEMFEQTKLLKAQNKDLKVLIWAGGIGGPESAGFSEMTRTHANRKQFIQSLKQYLELYRLDGVDLDWEFPGVHNRQRQHFSQLLHEIRREYQREHRTYLLSVAVAAPVSLIYIFLLLLCRQYFG